MDKDLLELGAILEGLADMYDRKREITLEMMHLYHNALKAHSLEQIKLGLSRHMADTESGQFFPKPADIIRHIEGSNEDKASLAWSVVDKSIRTIGPYQSVKFEDPIASECIERMGGWIVLCGSNSQEYPHIRHRFITLYKSLINRSLPNMSGYLHLGITDNQNRANGFKSPEEPILISTKKTKEISHD